MISGKRITQRVVGALKPDEIVWDADVKGFGIRCQRVAKVFVLKTREGGRQRWHTIGRYGSPWTVETARQEAKRLLGDVAAKKNPAAVRDARKRNPTVVEASEMFLEHVKDKRRASTHAAYKDYFDRLIAPVLGKLRVEDVTYSDVVHFHHRLRRTRYQANRAAAILSAMFTWAERHGYRNRNTNPCRDLEKFEEHERERFLSEAELARLGDALAKVERNGSESPFAIAALRLLVFLGARRNEILELKWEHVDLERAMLFLPYSKTGKKPVYLNAPALEVLTNLPRVEGNPHVICGARSGARLVNLRKPWLRIRARAQLDGVRLHDLRHSFGAIAASGGVSLQMTGRLLGHAKTRTTERYAHLAADPVRAANEAIGARIAAAMKGQSGDVVNLPGLNAASSNSTRRS